jgi:CheY-like chemotaxis protein
MFRWLKRVAEWPTLDHAEIVRRARILVVDDNEFPYKQLFERDGYTVQQWRDIDDLAALETGEYDLILLDLIGVGTAESADEGFGVLKHIRKVSPAQIVIAYSNADLSLAYQPFFRDADAVLHKTQTDYMEFKRTVDRLLNERFSLGFYIDRIYAELGDYGSKVPKVGDKARVAILTGSPQRLQRYLDKFVDDHVTIDRVIALVGTGAQIAGTWRQ